MSMRRWATPASTNSHRTPPTTTPTSPIPNADAASPQVAAVAGTGKNATTVVPSAHDPKNRHTFPAASRPQVSTANAGGSPSSTAPAAVAATGPSAARTATSAATTPVSAPAVNNDARHDAPKLRA